MNPETKEIFRKLKSNYMIIVWILLALIVVLGIFVRTSDISGLKDITTGDYTLGQDLDPFLYLRNAEAIINGTLTNPDMMWAAPLGAQPYAYRSLMPWTIVGLYKVLNIFHETSVTYAAIILPVVLTALAIIFFFLFVKKAFSYIIKKPYNYWGALIAALLYSVIPQMLHRTTAGIPEIESLGMPFLWLAFYFFLCAWENKKILQSSLYSVFAGLATGLMVWSWGGSKYVFLILALTVFISFMFNKIEKRNMLVYAIWWVVANFSVFLQNGSSLSTLMHSLPDFILSSFYDWLFQSNK